MPNYFTLHKISFFVFFLICTCEIYSQSQITGTVTDEITGEPLIGVSVLLKDSQGIGTTTDIDGVYQMEVTPDAILIFSYIGYEALEMPVGQGSRLDVRLVGASQQLDEVVVTALGIKRPKTGNWLFYRKFWRRRIGAV